MLQLEPQKPNMNPKERLEIWNKML